MRNNEKFNISEAFQRVKDASDKRKNEINECQAEIDDATKRLAEAETMKQNIVEANDLDAFARVKALITELETQKELSELRLKSLQQSDVMPGEGDEIIKQIDRELDLIDIRVAKKIMPLVNQIVEVANEAESEIAKGAKTLGAVYKLLNKNLNSGNVLRGIKSTSQAHAACTGGASLMLIANGRATKLKELSEKKI